LVCYESNATEREYPRDVIDPHPFDEWSAGRWDEPTEETIGIQRRPRARAQARRVLSAPTRSSTTTGRDWSPAPGHGCRCVSSIIRQVLRVSVVSPDRSPKKQILRSSYRLRLSVRIALGVLPCQAQAEDRLFLCPRPIPERNQSRRVTIPGASSAADYCPTGSVTGNRPGPEVRTSEST
jgi:hypothetical protein